MDRVTADGEAVYRVLSQSDVLKHYLKVTSIPFPKICIPKRSHLRLAVKVAPIL